MVSGCVTWSLYSLHFLVVILLLYHNFFVKFYTEILFILFIQPSGQTDRHRDPPPPPPQRPSLQLANEGLVQVANERPVRRDSGIWLTRAVRRVMISVFLCHIWLPQAKCC
jgi:hypothetical protein